ncbi:peptidylprolyl isomerase [bacterium]|nr:peptidylprolyl isomerase [bacterium]
MKLFKVLTISLLLFSTLFAEEKLINKMALRVNADVYTFYDLKKLLMPEDPEAVPVQALTDRKEKLVEMMTEVAIKKQAAAEEKIEVTEEEIERGLENVLQQNRIDLAQFEKELAKNGLTLEKYKNEILRTQLETLKLQRQVIMTMDVDETALHEIYEAQFSEPETYFTAAHIILMPGEKATEEEVKTAIDLIHKKIQSGELSFEEAARTYSQDGSSKDGGSLGTFSSKQMVPEFSEKLAGMREGELSSPFKTRYGWHIVRLDKSEKRAPQTFNEVYDYLRSIYYQKNADKMFKSWLQKKKSEAKIEVLF